MYAGGLCGASTALYQGILTNTALEVTERYPHTKRYTDLYDSVIDGKSINVP
jgi:vancomycin resistance protein YoaR